MKKEQKSICEKEAADLMMMRLLFLLSFLFWRGDDERAPAAFSVPATKIMSICFHCLNPTDVFTGERARAHRILKKCSSTMYVL